MVIFLHTFNIYVCMCVYTYIYTYAYIYIHTYTHTHTHTHTYIYTGFSDGSAGEESTCDAGDKGDWGSIPESGRSLGVRNWQPALVFLPRKSQGQRSLAGYSPKDMTE